MFCGKCGTKLENNVNFCPSCGNPQKKDNSVSHSENSKQPHNTLSNKSKTDNNKSVGGIAIAGLLFFGVLV